MTVSVSTYAVSNMLEQVQRASDSKQSSLWPYSDSKSLGSAYNQHNNNLNYNNYNYNTYNNNYNNNNHIVITQQVQRALENKQSSP